MSDDVEDSLNDLVRRAVRGDELQEAVDEWAESWRVMMTINKRPYDHTRQAEYRVAVDDHYSAQTKLLALAGVDERHR